MNTNVVAKKILIFGDSFVFGKTGGRNERLSPSERFTGYLQNILGQEYEVIEAGLRGRTLFGENGFFKDRNGEEQFGPTVGSHLPLDLVFIILGTNNSNKKSAFENSKVEGSLDKYLAELQDWSNFLDTKCPEVILVIPPNFNPEYFDNGAKEIFGLEAQGKLTNIQESMKNWAKLNDCKFVQTEGIILPGKGDGVHLSKEGNIKMAKLLEREIKDLGL